MACDGFFVVTVSREADAALRMRVRVLEALLPFGEERADVHAIVTRIQAAVRGLAVRRRIPTARSFAQWKHLRACHLDLQSALLHESARKIQVAYVRALCRRSRVRSLLRRCHVAEARRRKKADRKKKAKARPLPV